MACTHTNRRFCIPKRLTEVHSGQHPNCLHILLYFSRITGAFRFLLWWLFLHRRLRSRQRGSTFDCTFQKLLSVFIQTIQQVLRLVSASLSASTQGVITAFFPPSLFSNNVSPPLFAIPCVGQTPVSNFDCEREFTPVFLNVKNNLL